MPPVNEQKKNTGITRILSKLQGVWREKTITVTVSFPKIIFGSLFSLFIVIWIFIFGIMLGRGHNPEEAIPEVARLMPSPNLPPPAATLPLNEMLKPSELDYHDNLKGKAAPELPKVPPVSSKVPLQAKLEVLTPAKQKQNTAVPVQPAVTKAVEPTPPASKEELFLYVYQVAAFNNSAAAENLQKKLEQKGLSASVTSGEANGTMWYRTTVSFRSSSSAAVTHRRKLAESGVNQAILRSKSPIK